jgi:hypothetical protein
MLGGVGILALFFSILSPSDDLFQQELIRPTPPVVRVSAHAGAVLRRLTAHFCNKAFLATGHVIRIPRTDRLIAIEESLELDVHFHAAILIHSPPAYS